MRGKQNALTTLNSFFVSFSFVNSAEVMAQAKTSEDLSIVNPSNQLDHEEILSNWDEYLAPAPMGIFIMSQLLICSTRVADFAINSKIEEGKATKMEKIHINLLIHPESYCTTLVQIANESFQAFMLAHTNMDKIQLQMAQVPDYVRECVKLIQSNNKTAIKKLLPIRLERITEAAADGLKHSTQVRDSFDRLNRLIEQVILAIQASKGAREWEIRKTFEDAIEAEKTRKMEYKKRQDDFLQKEMEDAQQAVQRTQKNLEESSNFRVEDIFTFGITSAIRSATSTSNRRQAEIMLQQLKQENKQIEEEKGKICDEHIKSLKSLQITIGKEVSTDEMIKLLKDGTEKLGDLHAKWAGMTTYFESINNRIGIVMEKTLVNFVKEANGTEDNSLLEFMKYNIEKSLESSIMSHRIAATFVKVFNNYIMGPLKQMHGMLSIESAKLEEKQKDMLELCEKAMKGIQLMATEERNQAFRETENKVRSIQN